MTIMVRYDVQLSAVALKETARKQKTVKFQIFVNDSK
jgi:hypothetical protein